MADTKAEQPDRRDVDVDADGDIILALPKNLYIRVSSAVLSLVSPVFKAMLGPHFREGNKPRSSAQPNEIPLPEDDGIAMKHLCLLIHGRTGDSYNHGDRTFPTQLHALAVLADKYDCVEAISLPAEAMLSRFWNYRTTQPLSMEQMACLAMAAASLRLGPLFHAFTKSIVLDYHVPYTVLKPMMPLDLIMLLEQQRSAVRLKIYEEISSLSRTSFYCTTCKTSYKSTTTGNTLLYEIAKMGQGFLPLQLGIRALRPVLKDYHRVAHSGYGIFVRYSDQDLHSGRTLFIVPDEWRPKDRQLQA
ncbi:hypothetical protein KC340_g2003 [Hortaea werneckii]|nr:hypothetical protein KC342_g2420 [Hortaea werneckii]KAI7104625.1 hypothetical protein KC339_g4384 [Hortaea werneckii]KAI7228739.1 hypothetical protein KC365_g8328 [Hortaea werneckii]KAI7335753.1 hypothetical protein KC340_g2003 [Hortaea werneckii]KAI7374105.1 hypothetical protein KC328_g16210 [Hortaea werneckii]